MATEVFSFFAPARHEIALKLSNLAVRTTACENAAWIAEFNTIMNTLASRATSHNSAKEKIMWMSMEARKHLPETSYPAKTYDLFFHSTKKDQAGKKHETVYRKKFKSDGRTVINGPLLIKVVMAVLLQGSILVKYC